jgi:hypothetical protein
MDVENEGFKETYNRDELVDILTDFLLYHNIAMDRGTTEDKELREIAEEYVDESANQGLLKLQGDPE